MDVTFAWAAIIALGLFMYVILDGFDLGVGMIFPFFPDDGERDMMMRTIAPVWDGNGCMACLRRGRLVRGLSHRISIILSALYLPIVFMLICLIFRGVSFEIRSKAKRTKNVWNLAFMLGSARSGLLPGGHLRILPSRHTYFGRAFQWQTVLLDTALCLLTASD